MLLGDAVKHSRHLQSNPVSHQHSQRAAKGDQYAANGGDQAQNKEILDKRVTVARRSLESQRTSRQAEQTQHRVSSHRLHPASGFEPLIEDTLRSSGLSLRVPFCTSTSFTSDLGLVEVGSVGGDAQLTYLHLTLAWSRLGFSQGKSDCTERAEH